MEWILIVATLIILSFGFVFMDKLDKFMASPHFFPDRKEPVQNKEATISALVFGKLDLSDEIATLLEKLNISYTEIEDFNQLNMSAAYQYLFAVDESDFENLMICLFCEKTMGLKKRIAICNCFDNIKIFKENHVPYMCGYSISASSLVAELFPALQEDKEKTVV